MDDKVAKILITMDRKPMLILIGDFNARTGTLSDYSFHDTLRNLPIGDWYDVDPFYDKRLSCDTNENTNNFRYQLLNSCQLFGAHFTNGHVAGDEEGHLTCITPRGASVVDYCITSTQLFKKVARFEVIAEQFSSSVHLPIRCSFKLGNCVVEHNSDRSYNYSDRVKFLWTRAGLKLFFETLTKQSVMAELECINDEVLKNNSAGAVNILIRVLQSAADHMRHRPRIRDQHHKDPGRPKCWDKEMNELESKKELFTENLDIKKLLFKRT